MPRVRMVLLAILISVIIPLVVPGCQSPAGDSAELASLQKQTAALTRQLEETRANVELLEQQSRELTVTVQNLEAKIDQLKPLDSPSPMPAATVGNVIVQSVEQQPRSATAFGDEPSAAGEPPLALKKRVACADMWALFGQGASPERIATVLGATPEAIEQCEQKIGRGSQDG